MYEKNVWLETKRCNVVGTHCFNCLAAATFLGSSLCLRSLSSSPVLSTSWEILWWTVCDEQYDHHTHCVMNSMTTNPGHCRSVQKLVPYSSWANWKGPQGMWTLRCHLGLAVLLNWGDANLRLFSATIYLFFFCFPGSGIDVIGLRQERREKHMKRDPKVGSKEDEMWFQWWLRCWIPFSGSVRYSTHIS